MKLNTRKTAIAIFSVTTIAIGASMLCNKAHAQADPNVIYAAQQAGVRFVYGGNIDTPYGNVPIYSYYSSPPGAYDVLWGGAIAAIAVALPPGFDLLGTALGASLAAYGGWLNATQIPTNPPPPSYFLAPAPAPAPAPSFNSSSVDGDIYYPEPFEPDLSGNDGGIGGLGDTVLMHTLSTTVRESAITVSAIPEPPIALLLALGLVPVLARKLV